MNVGNLLPIMVYDDMCYLCAKFAKVVSVLAGKKILIVGHYSEYGMKIKSEIFPNGYDPTRMFWFITRKVAYGGRSAILSLILAILSNKSKRLFRITYRLHATAIVRLPRQFLLGQRAHFK